MKEQIHGGDVYRHRDVLDFSANMNPLGTPRSVIDAAAESLKEICNYPDIRCTVLTQALAEYEQVPAEWLICGNGAAELIFMLALGLKPEKALLLAPAFAEYEQALRTVGCELHWHSLTDERGFSLDRSILEEITPETDLVILCNPNNPTGVLTGPELMRDILEKCRETGTFLAVDECFLDFVEERERYSLKDCLADFRNLFLLKAFTKRYAMAGIRLGYGICSDPGVLEKMQASVQPWSVSVPAQAAGTAALREEAYVEQAREMVRTEREFLRQGLEKLGFRVYDSRANYLFFRGPRGLTGHALKNHVLIRDCSNYRGLMEGYYRVAVRTREENRKLLEALG
jgi:threonine-phosphate decarboxylase